MWEDTSTVHIAYLDWCLVAKLLLVKTLFFSCEHSVNANHV